MFVLLDLDLVEQTLKKIQKLEQNDFKKLKLSSKMTFKIVSVFINKNYYCERMNKTKHN